MASDSPLAPTSLLARHTLPPEAWGRPAAAAEGREEDYWKGITGSAEPARRAGAAFRAGTLVGCEGFLMQKTTKMRVHPADAGSAGSAVSGADGRPLLTWQQRYLRMSPDDLRLTLWDIPAGAVVVARPAGAGRQVSLTSVARLMPWVGKNKTRFDVAVAQDSGGEEVLSFMADTPEDCARWVNAFKMVLRVLGLMASREANHAAAAATVDTSSSSSSASSPEGNGAARATSVFGAFLTCAKTALASDPTLKGRIVYGLPAFFQAIDRDGQGRVSDLEFEGAINRLAMDTPAGMVEALCREFSSAGPGPGLGQKGDRPAYPEFVRQLVRAVTEETAERKPTTSPGREARKSPKRAHRNTRISRAAAAQIASPTISSRAKADAATQKASALAAAAALSSPAKSSSPQRARKGKSVHLRLPATAQEIATAPKTNAATKNTSSASSSSWSSSSSSSSRGHSKKARKTRYDRPWLHGNAAGARPNTKGKRAHRNHARTSNRTAATIGGAADAALAAQGNHLTANGKHLAAAAVRSAAVREETNSLHKALTSAQQLIAAETRARLEAEKTLTREKRRDEEARRRIELEQVTRDEANAHNLDKLHAMYGRQIEKLRGMLQHEGSQLAGARKEIAELTMSLQNAAAQGVRVTLPSNTSGGTGHALRNAVSLAAAEKGAADLVLLERLASVEEELANASDREKILREENRVIKAQLAETLSSAAQRNARAETAEALSGELRKALSLSKEESRLLDGERRRLMRENEKLARAVEKMDRFVYGRTPQFPVTAHNRSFDAATAAAAIAAARAEKAAQFAAGRGAGVRRPGKSVVQRQAEATERLSQSFSAAPKGFLAKQKRAAAKKKKQQQMVNAKRRKQQQQREQMQQMQQMQQMPLREGEAQNLPGMSRKKAKKKKKQKKTAAGGRRARRGPEREIMHTVSMSVLD
jgi:hypothetical protein